MSMVLSVVLLVIINCATANIISHGDEPAALSTHFHHGHAHYRYEPIPGGNNYSVITTPGATAKLKCRYRHLGNNQISWIRMRDWHILSTNSFVYTSDKRVTVVRDRSQHEWALVIADVNATADNGTYQCQVAFGEQVLSTFIHLYVKRPRAQIAGAKEYTILPGRSINITCSIIETLYPVSHVQWLFNHLQLKSNTSTVSIVTTLPGSSDSGHLATMTDWQSRAAAVAQSTLSIQDASRNHTGVYTCSAPQLDTDSVDVFVGTEADKVAAMSRRRGLANTRAPTESVSLYLASLSVLLSLLSQQCCQPISCDH